MAEETKRNSVDLAKGVPLDQLPDGGRLVGRVNGEDVLLVRSGDEIFAVSPHCTHYNGCPFRKSYPRIVMMQSR